MSSRIPGLSHFIHKCRSCAALMSALVAIVFSAVPIYFAQDARESQRRNLASEAERHLSIRMIQAQVLFDRAKTIPSIVALTISQAGRSAHFEGTIRNLLAMSGIVDAVSIASINGAAIVIHRDQQVDKGNTAVVFRPAARLVLDNHPILGFGDGSVLIRESLAEVDVAGNTRFWGHLTAEASFAHLIQEMQLLALVNDGFGVNFRLQWPSGTETVIFHGGGLAEEGASRSIKLPSGALLTLSVVPPSVTLVSYYGLAWVGLLVVGILLFLLTYHMLRRPQLLERQVEARTQEIVAEKAELKNQIAARIKAESHLERSHALLDSIFEHIPAMIVLKRVSDRRIARINSSGERMLGRSRDFLVGRSNEEIYAPALADYLTQGDIQALAQPGLIELPVQRIEMPAAAPRWISYSKTVLRDRDGEPRYILEFGEDLTYHKNLDRVLMVLSEINHLIIYTRDRENLLKEARRILQEKGGFPAVWIHVKQDGQSRFIADASTQQYAARICAEIENPERQCWPERRLHCQTLDCCNLGLSAELNQLGLQSLIHLPMRSGDFEWGDIGILGATGRGFSAEEQSLLDEIAGNLSFALDALHQEERRRTAENKLELSARILENNSEGIIITDAANRILMVNKAFTAVTGYSAEEVIGKTPALLSSGRHNAEFFNQMRRALEQQGEWRGEIINRRKNGEEFPEWLTISLVRGDDGLMTNHVAVFSDLTARRKIEARVDFLAHYDALTALPNREYFCECLTAALAVAQDQGKRVAVIYFDLDRFKLINETVGHVAADQLLVEVSNRLVAEAKSKRNVARLGGDQFAVLIPSLDSAGQAVQFVQRLQESFSQPFPNFLEQSKSIPIHLSASFGISIFPDDGSDAETLARNADSAMYKAIADGGNKYRFFLQKMNEHAAERVLLESRLRHALERNELAVQFQPFVAAASGRIVGAEALLRWYCPELGGYVSPLIFIPLLEEIGLIRQVGEWVLNQACAQVRRWESLDGDKLFVAVNISALQLTANFPAVVEKAIADHGISPDRLELELTEGVIMHDASHSIGILHNLRALGIHLSIDDFGTGYSSLSYLKQLPMNTLKIDRSFVLDIPGDAEDVSITRAILALGLALHMKIIAEGVETIEQVEFLCQNGCDQLQGYHFSKPVSAAEFIRLLTETPTFKLPASGQRTLQLLKGKRING